MPTSDFRIGALCSLSNVDVRSALLREFPNMSVTVTALPAPDKMLQDGLTRILQFAPDPDATCADCPVDRLLDGLREARATMRACRTTLGDDSADIDRLIGTWRDFPARKAAK